LHDNPGGVTLSGRGAPGAASDLTAAIAGAQRGLRHDVERLVEALEHAELLVPLARSMPDVRYGERVELEQELSLTPHMLVDTEGNLYAVMFSDAEFVEAPRQQLGWTTDDGALEYCALPARAALEMALSVIDDESVVGLVLNPLDASELMLRREEVASIAQRRALPLVGYVSAIPEQDSERTLVAEPGEPLAADLIQALELCLAGIADVNSHALRRTFNAERDLEPHLTLELELGRAGADTQAIAERVVAAIGGLLPPPGYIDIFFREPVSEPPN
jgi:SseB protein N-terminal domain